jgi:hypothetical protein
MGLPQNVLEKSFEMLIFSVPGDPGLRGECSGAFRA